jgi:hypothetical protein
MLLITAIFFVKIAQMIPGPSVLLGAGSTAASPKAATLFYEWMAALFLFDVVVLIIDWIKTDILNPGGHADLDAYPQRIVLNLPLFGVCLSAAYPFWGLEGLTAQTLAITVLVFAFLRTLLDYIFGRKFMFP